MTSFLFPCTILRTYVCQDIIRRILEGSGQRVTYVLGMTDIDDKIVQRARERDVNWLDLARGYEAEFLADMRDLKVRPPSLITRVSDHIPEIIGFVETLKNGGNAYVVPDGSVYFDTAHFQSQHEYGKLQPLRQANQTSPGVATEAFVAGEQGSPTTFEIRLSAQAFEGSPL